MTEIDGKDATFSKAVIKDTNHNSVVLLYTSSNEDSAHFKQVFWELSTTISQKFPSVLFFAVDLSVSETVSLMASCTNYNESGGREKFNNLVLRCRQKSPCNYWTYQLTIQKQRFRDSFTIRQLFLW